MCGARRETTGVTARLSRQTGGEMMMRHASIAKTPEPLCDKRKDARKQVRQSVVPSL